MTEGREELPLQLLGARPSVRTNHDRHLDPEVLYGTRAIVDPGALFPPPRSTESLDDVAGGISISLALNDGLDRSMLKR